MWLVSYMSCGSLWSIQIMSLMICKTSITLNGVIVSATGFSSARNVSPSFGPKYEGNSAPTCSNIQQILYQRLRWWRDGEGPMCCRFKCSPMLWKTKKRKFQLMNDDSCSDAIVLVLMRCRNIGSDLCCLFYCNKCVLNSALFQVSYWYFWFPWKRVTALVGMTSGLSNYICLNCSKGVHG